MGETASDCRGASLHVVGRDAELREGGTSSSVVQGDPDAAGSADDVECVDAVDEGCCVDDEASAVVNAAEDELDYEDAAVGHAVDYEGVVDFGAAAVVGCAPGACSAASENSW